METKDWIIIGGLVLSFCTTLYALGSKAIAAWERVQKETSKERIEAIAKLHLKEMYEEIKENYAEMISLLKNGTFK